MRLYNASMSLKVVKEYWRIFKEPINVLLSYALIGSETQGFLVAFRNMIKSIIADSGAWSDAHNKIKVRIESLISYLQLWGHMFDIYFNLDTDFSDRGFENNIANQIIMEKAGLRPVPVVHNFFDEEIEHYVQSGKYDWLALGSSQSTNIDDLRYAVDRIRRWGNPNIKIHWFGGSKFEWLCKLPIAACDTSSWAKAGSFGHINYWNPHVKSFNKTHRIYIGGLTKKMGKGEYHFVDYRWRRELEEYLSNTFGYTYGDLCGYDDKFYMQVINTRFYVELERRVNAERATRGIPLE
jgi:hypothetical protein